jgi:integrase/recombinase XerD
MDIAGFLKKYSGLSPLTLKAYQNTLLMLEAKVGNSEPTDDEVRKFLKHFKVGTTLQRHKAAIKRYFTYTKRPWVFDSKEFASVRKKLPKYLKPDKIALLVGKARDQHERMFIQTLFITGIRIAELMSLEPDNIEEEGIRFTGKRSKERFVFILDNDFLSELREYAKHCPGRLFPDTYYNYWLLLRRLCLEADVEIISPHKLRHSRAVDLLNRGLTLGGLQTFLGHEQPGTSLIYAQLTQRDLRKELEKLEE